MGLSSKLKRFQWVLCQTFTNTSGARVRFAELSSCHEIVHPTVETIWERSPKRVEHNGNLNHHQRILEWTPILLLANWFVSKWSFFKDTYLYLWYRSQKIHPIDRKKTFAYSFWQPPISPIDRSSKLGNWDLVRILIEIGTVIVLSCACELWVENKQIPWYFTSIVLSRALHPNVNCQLQASTKRPWGKRPFGHDLVHVVGNIVFLQGKLLLFGVGRILSVFPNYVQCLSLLLYETSRQIIRTENSLDLKKHRWEPDNLKDVFNEFLENTFS